MDTVGSLINDICNKFPNQVLIHDFNRQEKFTYGEWAKDSAGLAQELKDRGFAPGDYGMMRFGNDYGYLVTYGGIARAEGVVAPVPLRLTPWEFARLLNLVAPKWLFVNRVGWDEMAETVMGSSVQNVGIYHEGNWEWLEIQGVKVPRDPDPTLAHLRFTSGSQGEPKAVMLTHHNMIYRIDQPEQYAQEGDVFFLPIPFVFRPDRLIQAIAVGGAVVVYESIYPRQIVRCFREAKVTFAWLVPTIIGLLIQLDIQEIPKDLVLRAVSTGGAYLYRPWEQRFEDLFGVPVYQQYGMSEGCVAFENPPKKRRGSVGKPSPMVVAKICNAEGKKLPNGEVGELFYCGENVMRGYLDRPDLTAVTLRGGWLRTGDLARFDEAGYLFIEGRLKDLIHVGGLKFSPREVEDVLLIYSGIREVSVIAVNHPVKGEVGKAYYVADEPIRGGELRVFCQAYLADFKIPKEWEQVDVLPKLSSGKIARQSIVKP